jgi:hypothetical protein
MAKVKRLSVVNLSERDIERLEIDDEPGWYVDDPNGDVRWVGAYPTKAEATEAKRGLERFWRSNKWLLENQPSSG